MKARQFVTTTMIFIFMMTGLFGGAIGTAGAQAVPTIVTDKADYAPGEIVTVTGTGWLAGEAVHIFVNDDVWNSWWLDSSPDPVADTAGGFTYQFQLPEWFIANYRVTASGLVSGLVATTTFTDVAVGTYDQCSNDLGDGYAAGDLGCRWTNGGLQPNNSVYYEGDSTVQRTWLTDFVPGSTHTVTFTYGTTKGGKHAYDFLTKWNWSESWITLADLCQDITGCETASVMEFPIPTDPLAGGFDAAIAQASRMFTIRGGTITGVSVPTVTQGSYAADSDTSITVTFTVDSTGAMCDATTCGIALWFGAHVASQNDWDPGNGASSIPGAPYHVQLALIDGASAGQRDNQMQSAVVVPNGTITIVKQTVPASTAVDFGFTLTNGANITENFSLDTDADPVLSNTITFSLPPGTYTANEVSIPAGWEFNSLTCVDPTNNTTWVGSLATIILASNETVTCTYLNIDHPTAVTFVGQAANAGDDQVYLSWETATEIDLFGFNILRSDSIGGTPVQINSELIPAKGMGGLIGASYEFTDSTVERGKTYFYWIQLDETGGLNLAGDPLIVTITWNLRLPIVFR